MLATARPSCYFLKLKPFLLHSTCRPMRIMKRADWGPSTHRRPTPTFGGGVPLLEFRPRSSIIRRIESVKYCAALFSQGSHLFGRFDRTPGDL